MITITVEFQSNNDLAALQQELNNLGLTYHIDRQSIPAVSENLINDLLKTKQDFLDGKTSARNWSDIEDDLNRAYN